jgi:hypothetical protein
VAFWRTRGDGAARSVPIIDAGVPGPTWPVAVVDVETTGLHPRYHHRVIEVAVVTLDPDGRQGIHGVRGVDVREAPHFEEVRVISRARIRAFSWR